LVGDKNGHPPRGISVERNRPEETAVFFAVKQNPLREKGEIISWRGEEMCTFHSGTWRKGKRGLGGPRRRKKEKARGFASTEGNASVKSHSRTASRKGRGGGIIVPTRKG